MRNFIYLLFFCLFTTGVFSQKKKQIAKYKIESCLVTETRFNRTFNDSKQIFDKNGFLIEETNYNDSGVFVSTKKYSYNQMGEINTEQKLDLKNKLLELKTYKYNSKKQKTDEFVFNQHYKLIKRVLYTYNLKGLKLEKKVFDNSNRIVSVKKYQYTYY